MQRFLSPTPAFFKKVRRVGLLLAALSGALINAPVALPAIVITIAGYLGVAGTVAGIISQAATDTDDNKKEGLLNV